MNRLANETSPYLRQHADNPVDWFPWGDAAFAAAAERGVPIFLSIGYSACHWCHVMAHESFEDVETAALMNDLFVNVKVDREERPDIDAIYMQATQAMTGSGGWPMSVWLTPTGAPFHAGTYFPPEERHGNPSFQHVCRAIATAWNEQRSEVDDIAVRLTETIAVALPEPPPDAAGLDASTDRRVIETLRRDFDAQWGGFGRAPKFPHGSVLSWLARHDPDTEMLVTTLDAMACGGIYDQVGGGFARYSVDNEWSVPHFEKMLYDNALLTRAYTDGYQRTGAERYRRIAAETIAWTLRELRHPDGGFYSAYDADSEGVEGKYYVWQRAEVEAVLGVDASTVAEFFGITETGNFVDPHTGFSGTVLHVVERSKEPTPAIRAALDRLALLRSTRVAPGCDDKVLLAWNAYMVRALAEAATVFAEPTWMQAARETAEFILANLRRSDGRLLRSWQADAPPLDGWGADGRGRLLGFAQDHAALCDALTTLGELDDPRWFDDAADIADALIDLFHDPDGGGFFTTGRDAESLIVRAKDQMDNATPSEQSLAANALLRLAVVFDDERYRTIATACVTAVAPYFDRHPTGFGYAMEAAARIQVSGTEVVVVGPVGHPDTEALWNEVHATLACNRVTVRVDPTVHASSPPRRPLPLLAGRTHPHDAPTAYVCEGSTCQLPVTDVASLRAQLAQRLR